MRTVLRGMCALCAFAACMAFGNVRHAHVETLYNFSALYCTSAEEAKTVAIAYAYQGQLVAYSIAGAECRVGILEFYGNVQYVAAYQGRMRVSVFEAKEVESRTSRYIIYPVSVESGK